MLGLVSAYIAFGSPHVAFLFGLAIFVVGWLLQRFMFFFTSMYIMPMPDFTIDSAKWLAMSFGFVPLPHGRIPHVAMVLADDEYAKNVHSLLYAWACGNLNDEEKNINVSIITKSDNSYVFFIFPNPKRTALNRFFRQMDSKAEKKDEFHRGLAMALFLGKRFEITKGSFFPTFRRTFPAGFPFMFEVLVMHEGKPKSVEGLGQFRLLSLRIVAEQQLQPHDLELQVLRALGHDE